MEIKENGFFGKAASWQASKKKVGIGRSTLKSIK
jgi:hypothetical protein